LVDVVARDEDRKENTDNDSIGDPRSNDYHGGNQQPESSTESSFITLVTLPSLLLNKKEKAADRVLAGDLAHGKTMTFLSKDF